MPLYVCSFCDHNTKVKHYYYNHLYKHINENNALFDKEEIELCIFYHNKIYQYQKDFRQNNKDNIYQKKKEYYQNNKERICQKEKEYYENNKDKESQRFKKYRENNKGKLNQYNREYYKNNKDRISQRKKEFYLRTKLEKEEDNILDVNDSD
jgi:hypothetical protein